MAKRNLQRWNGSADAALSVLRAEYAFIVANQARLLGGGDALVRTPVHVRALDGIDASTPLGLASLIAAAPFEKRNAITAAFCALLGSARAAELRGLIAGTVYAIEGTFGMQGARFTPPGVKAHTSDRGRHLVSCSYRVTVDAAGARDAAARLEAEARAAGCDHVDVRAWRAA